MKLFSGIVLSLLEMAKLSSEQKTKVVQYYIQTGSIIETKRIYRSIFGPRNTPSSRAISRVTQNFIATDTTSEQARSGKKPIVSDGKGNGQGNLIENPSDLHPPPGPASQPIKMCYAKHTEEEAETSSIKKSQMPKRFLRKLKRGAKPSGNGLLQSAPTVPHFRRTPGGQTKLTFTCMVTGTDRT